MRPVRVNFSAGRLERGMPMTVSYVGSGTVRLKTERRSLNRQSRKTGTMNTKAEIQTMLAAYTARYPDERAAMEPFVRYVASFDAPALYDRKNFVGHLTAGALIVSRQTGCVLLLKHKQLGKWLQPGGHVEASDASVLDAAFREAREETGIGRDRLELLAPSGSLLPVPADADGHYIPLGYARRIGLDARFPAGRAEDPGRLVRAGNRLLASCRPRGGLPVERTIGNGRPVCLVEEGNVRPIPVSVSLLCRYAGGRSGACSYPESMVIEWSKVLKEVSPNGPSDSEVSDRRYSLRSHGALFLYPICVVPYRSSDFDAVRVFLSR